MVLDLSAAPARELQVSVVFQTHWDREWYYPHEAFLSRLLRVMERVATLLESGSIKTFLFDGQTAAYEDFKAHAEPALLARVERLARDGRLILGPWYVMADEFLVSGESLLRNLQIGMEDATAAGNCQRVGYLPDTFGHIAQMPQLLREFGIESAVLWRGADVDQSEFDWRSPNGDTVGAVFLPQGYYQHPLNVPDYRTALTQYLEKVLPYSTTGHVLLTQGGDHLLPGADVAPRIASLNQDGAGTDGLGGEQRAEFREDTLAAYTAKVMALTAGKRPSVEGELRANAQAFVLPDVLSTRRYLKRLHQKLEDELIGTVEPVFAQLRVSVPQRALAQCWRSLIQNQAHDSICGCSVDRVHRDMEHRFDALAGRLDGLRLTACAEAGMSATIQHVASGRNAFGDDTAFTLFNPRVQAHEGPVTLSLFVAGARRSAVPIQRADGVSVRSSVVSVRPHQEFHSPDDDFPDVIAGHLYECIIWCELPAMGSVAFVVKPAEERGDDLLVSEPRVANASARIESTTIAVECVADGTVQIEQLHASSRQPTRLTSALALQHELDAGDSYNFSPPPQQVTTVQSQFSVLSRTVADGFQELVLAVEMQVPSGLSEERQGGASALVSNTGELRLRLIEGSEVIDCRLTWRNRAKDQRTRLVLRTPEAIDQTYADSAFVWQQRPATLAQYPQAMSRNEMPPAVMPSLSAVSAGGLWVAHRAMHEWEVIQNSDGPMSKALALTLVRSVGWLSRRDLVTRGVGAGPDMETPGAQCLRDDEFEFQLGFANTGSPKVLAHAEAFRRPPVPLRGVADAWRAPLDIGNASLRLSALRVLPPNGTPAPSESRRELRVWNPTDQPQRAALQPGWVRVRADGAPFAASDDATLVQPHQIATWHEAMPERA